jgi:hypothetical protein
MDCRDEYEGLNYDYLEGKYVDAHELVSFLVASIKQDKYDDIPTSCYESVIGFVFSHVKEK